MVRDIRLSCVPCEQERPGLVVLTIELENALAQTSSVFLPSKLWSPYREPLTKFLNRYAAEVSMHLPFVPCKDKSAILLSRSPLHHGLGVRCSCKQLQMPCEAIQGQLKHDQHGAGSAGRQVLVNHLHICSMSHKGNQAMPDVMAPIPKSLYLDFPASAGGFAPADTACACAAAMQAPAAVPTSLSHAALSNLVGLPKEQPNACSCSVASHAMLEHVQVSVKGPP